MTTETGDHISFHCILSQLLGVGLMIDDVVFRSLTHMILDEYGDNIQTDSRAPKQASKASKEASII